ncbi:MAG: branched-chain amino acid ABC transporter permease [Proteobacteria bacterium]|nr:branched-chain amino acid ABC transporter permease [Pseudomonadota bacterium]NIS72002.1 branched-chain amino acid ABC transporter permease [Pseudomonadota bacterium]
MEPYVYFHFFLNGLAHSTCFFLLAAGLSLIFGVLGIFNMAHGAFFMIGAYFTFQLVQWTQNFWLCFVASPLLVAVVGFLVERFLLRCVYRISVNFQLLLTFGLILVIEDATRLIWGVQWRTVEEADLLKGSISLLGMDYPRYNLFHIAAGFLVFVGLCIFLYRTKFGKTVVAASSDRELANGLGINVPRMYTVVFCLGAWLAGLMGVLHAPLININLDMGHKYIITAFAVVVIGGLRSVVGAYAGSLILGQLTAFGTLYVPFFERLFMFLFMALVLIWRPQGLFGEAKA